MKKVAFGSCQNCASNVSFNFTLELNSFASVICFLRIASLEKVGYERNCLGDASLRECFYSKLFRDLVCNSVALICILLSACAVEAAPKPKPQSLAIPTTTLPSGSVGTTYSATLNATGGTTPYQWSLTSGTLPGGLSLSKAGLISGTPTTSANATSLTFKVTDSNHPVQSKSVTLSLTITPSAVAVTTGSLPSGQVGNAYTANLAANGGTTPYKWSLSSGTLPQGLSLSTSGAITGTPTTAQNVTGLNFLVTDDVVLRAPNRQVGYPQWLSIDGAIDRAAK
jgi:hypothetical protein